MKTRYHLMLAALFCAGLTSTAFAQNYEVTGTVDANGIYVLRGPEFNIAGRPTYQIPGQQLTIYACDQTTGFDGGAGCGGVFWVIASEPHSGPNTPSSSILYLTITSGATPPETLADGASYEQINGLSFEATVTGTAELPVELTSFEAVASGQKVQLRWATDSETNNAGFTVEMKQGETFAARGFVAGNGTTLEAQQYAFDAGELAPGRYTFRLKQVDFDGAFEYSPEVEVAVALSEAFHFSAPQPNPMRNAARFSITVQQAQAVSVRVYDVLGRAVDTLYEGAMAAGETQTLVLDRGNLPAGLYLIQLQGSHVQSTRQITLL